MIHVVEKDIETIVSCGHKEAMLEQISKDKSSYSIQGYIQAGCMDCDGYNTYCDYYTIIFKQKH